MAYMDEQALEREKSKQAMIAGKQPLLGDDTSRALHALGVNLGLVPPGTPPSQITQLIEGLLKGPSAKSIHVDEQKPLQVQPLVGQVTSSLQRPMQSDDSIGETISGGFGAARASKMPLAFSLSGIINLNKRASSEDVCRSLNFFPVISGVDSLDEQFGPRGEQQICCKETHKKS